MLPIKDMKSIYISLDTNSDYNKLTERELNMHDKVLISKDFTGYVNNDGYEISAKYDKIEAEDCITDILEQTCGKYMLSKLNDGAYKCDVTGRNDLDGISNYVTTYFKFPKGITIKEFTENFRCRVRISDHKSPSYNRIPGEKVYEVELQNSAIHNKLSWAEVAIKIIGLTIDYYYDVTLPAIDKFIDRYAKNHPDEDYYDYAPYGYELNRNTYIFDGSRINPLRLRLSSNDFKHTGLSRGDKAFRTQQVTHYDSRYSA